MATKVIYNGGSSIEPKTSTDAVVDASGKTLTDILAYMKSGESVKEIYIGKVVQKSISNLVTTSASTTQSMQLSDTNASKYVTMNDKLVLPYRGMEFKATLPSTINARLFFTSKNPSNGAYASANYCAQRKGATEGVIKNGNTYTIKNEGAFYRITFYNADGSDLSASDVQTLIDNGSIKFEYTSKDYDIVEYNEQKRSALNSVRNYRRSGGDDTANFVFMHISDIHGDVVRLERAMQFAVAEGVDCVLYSGDTVLDIAEDGMDFFYKTISKYDVPFVPLIGNHDMGKLRTPSTEALSHQEAYDMVLKPFVDGGKIEATSGSVYYYKDITWASEFTNTANFRVICLNEYEGADWAKKHISQAQIDWFISTLLSTPENYKVIVMMHGMEYGGNASAEVLTPYDGISNFVQKYRNNIAGISGTPFSKIVLAWQKKGTISDSFTNADDSSVVNINADFSSVANAEFICFLSGHEHQDYIGYNPTGDSAKKQVTMNITCSSGYSFIRSGGFDTLAQSGDIDREPYDNTQDSFNLVGVDTLNKVLKVVRIGADVTKYMVHRDIGCIPYA